MKKEQLIRTYTLLSMLNMFSVSFSMATYVSFLLSKGLNLYEVNLTNAVFFGTILVMEIPTGAYADDRGRKKSFLVSCVLRSILCPLIYATSNSLPLFMVAEAIGAIGHTFASGAFTAWFVDELHSHGGTDLERRKTLATAGVYSSLFAGPVASLVGGWLGSYNLMWPWLAASACGCITLLVANSIMREDSFTPNQTGSITATACAGLRYVRYKPLLWALIGTGALQVLSIQAPNMQWQPFFLPLLHNQTWLGALGAGIQIMIGVGAWLARRHWSTCNQSALLTIIQVSIGLGILLTGVFGGGMAGLSIFLLHEVARGMYNPVYTSLLHAELPKEQRATIDSFDSMVRHLGGLIGLTLSGWIANRHGIVVTWICSGALLSIGGLALWKFRD